MTARQNKTNHQAQRNMDEESSEDANEGEAELPKRRRPPDKQAHLIEVEYYTNLIHEKESLYKSLNSSRNEKTALPMGNQEDYLLKLKYFNDEKEKRSKRKQVIDAELKELSRQLLKKTETCGKLQASLRYKDEQRTNDAIKRLEKHLSTQQLKLSEEKKLVSEIDALRRSRKNLGQYGSAKQEVDQLRHKQSQLRSERDTLIRETREMKAKENNVKIALDALKTEDAVADSENDQAKHDKESLKKEISALYAKRRELRALYQQEITRHLAEEQKVIERKMKEKEMEKREEERISKNYTQKTRGMSAREAKPFEEETKICTFLIQYLEPLRILHSTGHEEVKPACQAAQEQAVPKHELSPEKHDGSILVRRSDEDLPGLFAISSRKMGRKGSRKGRRISCQKVVLHPHLLEQFFMLNVDPPSTCADAGRIIEQLKEQQDFYEESTRIIIEQSQVSYGGEDKFSNTTEEPSVEPVENYGNPGSSSGNISTKEDARTTIGDTAEYNMSSDLIGNSVSSEFVGTIQESENINTEGTSTQPVVLQEPTGISGISGDNPDNDQELDHIDQTSGIPRTSGGNPGYIEQGLPKIDEILSEEVTVTPRVKLKDVGGQDGTKITDEELFRNNESCFGSVCDSSLQHSAITDTLEKGLNNLVIKDSTKEIEVRAT